MVQQDLVCTRVTILIPGIAVFNPIFLSYTIYLLGQASKEVGLEVDKRYLWEQPGELS